MRSSNHLACAALAAGTLLAPHASLAKTLTPLWYFENYGDGENPQSVIFVEPSVDGSQLGSLYAVVSGSLYKYDTYFHALSLLYTFPEGANPNSDLLLRQEKFQDAKLYGTTRYGGTYGVGTVFSYDLTTNTETTIYSFGGSSIAKHDNSDGAQPESGVAFIGHNIWGFTAGGGNSDTYGTAYEINPDTGTEDSWVNVPPNPLGVPVVINGAMYAVSPLGGGYGAGAVFKFDTKSHQSTILYSFQGAADGASPEFGLTLANGQLYGGTAYGGTNGWGSLFSVDATSGAETTIHDFTGGTDGGVPTQSFMSAHGLVFGTATRGGKFGKGLIFTIDPKTALEKTAYDFKGGPYGWEPSGLAFHKGTFYGTTFWGGVGTDQGYGLIYQWGGAVPPTAR